LGLSEVEIRQAVLAEHPPAFELLKRFFVEEGFETPLAEMSQSLKAMLAHPGTSVFLAWQSNLACGVATVRYTPSLEHGLYAEIEDLYILPELRGQGLAKLLVDHCCAWCQAQGCSSVEVCVTPEAEASHGLSRFYQRLGFGDTGRSLFSRSLG
jgi:aminoglycoside 6'-N-acetyltransferase I